MSKENECENADKNPLCPYITRISKLEIKITEIKTDISWLKKGYWLQMGILLSVLGLIIKVYLDIT